MKLLVTGATGFLGREVVRLAAAAGHDVLAMVRPSARTDAAPWTLDRVTIVRGDLRAPGAWCTEIRGIDAVVNLAATLSGDLGTQVAGTIVPTENLLRVLDAVRLKRFVHVSSMVVYDFAALPRGSILTEASALVVDPTRRGPYTETKLFQERLVREFAREHRTPLVVVRPGAVYGPGAHWDSGVALHVGPIGFVYSPMAKFPVVHVTDCAQAIVNAVDAPDALQDQTYNLFADELPSFWHFNTLCRKAGARGDGFPVPAPWHAVAAAGAAVEWVNRRFLRGRLRLPEPLTYPRMQTRWKPLRYSNEAAKRDLRWTPSVTLADGIVGAVKQG